MLSSRPHRYKVRAFGVTSSEPCTLCLQDRDSAARVCFALHMRINVCQEKLETQLCVPCGHTFCRACLDDLCVASPSTFAINHLHDDFDCKAYAAERECLCTMLATPFLAGVDAGSGIEEDAAARHSEACSCTKSDVPAGAHHRARESANCTCLSECNATGYSFMVHSRT